MGAVLGTATIIRLYQKLKASAQPMKKDEQLIIKISCGGFISNNTFGSLEERTQTLHVMEALTHPNTHLMGLYCSDKNAIKVTDTLLGRITRRAGRDNMFDVISKTILTKKPDVKKIQHDIACSLGLKLDEKSTFKRAIYLHDSIKKKQKILVIICELYKGIDLKKVGIPYGADHTGSKILLTSTSNDVLSNQMHTQKNFTV